LDGSAGVLGPVDPQLSDPRYGGIPAVSLLKVIKEKGVSKVKDELLILGDITEKAIKQMENLVYELTKDKLGEEKARELAKIMVEGRWTHDYPITVEEARRLGLSIKTEIPPEVYQLMELYPQPAALEAQRRVHTGSLCTAQDEEEPGEGLNTTTGRLDYSIRGLVIVI